MPGWDPDTCSAPGAPLLVVPEPPELRCLTEPSRWDGRGALTGDLGTGVESWLPQDSCLTGRQRQHMALLGACWAEGGRARWGQKPRCP